MIVVVVSLQDVLPVGWKMDSVCTTQIHSRRRRNKVRVSVHLIVCPVVGLSA